MNKEHLAKKVSLNLFWNQLRHFSLYPLTFLLSIILARGLGPNSYGIYAGIMALFGIMGLFSSFGLEGAASILLPQTNQNSYKLNASFIIKRFTAIRTGATLFIAVLFMLKPEFFIRLISEKPFLDNLGILIFTTAIYFTSLNINLVAKSFYRGLLKFKLLSIIDTLSFSLNLILCFIVLRYTQNLSILFAALIFSQLISFCFLFLGIKDYFRRKAKSNDLKKTNRLCFNLYFTRFVQYAIGNQKDLLIIGFFFQDPKLLGFYNIATKLTDAFSSLLTMGIGEVSLPSFVEAYSNKGKGGLRTIWHAFLRIETVLTIPCLGFAILFADQLIIIFFSADYFPAVKVFEVYCIIILISDGFLGGGTSQKVLYAIGKQNLVVTIMIFSGIINLLLSVFLIPKFGILGAACASGIAIIAWKALELISCIYSIGAKYPIVFTNKVVLSVMISYILTNFFKVSDIFSIILTGILFISSYIAVLFILKPFDYEDEILLASINPKLKKAFSYFCKKKSKAKIER